MSGSRVCGSDGAGGAGPDAALQACSVVLREVGGRPGFAFSDAELVECLRGVHEVIAVAESVRLRLVEALRTRPGAVPGSGPAGGAKRFLTEALHVSEGQAQTDLDAAQAAYSPDATVPIMGAALADGDVSRAHLEPPRRPHRPHPPRPTTGTGGSSMTSSGARVRWAPSTRVPRRRRRGPRPSRRRTAASAPAARGSTSPAGSPAWPPPGPARRPACSRPRGSRRPGSLPRPRPPRAGPRRTRTAGWAAPPTGPRPG